MSTTERIEFLRATTKPAPTRKIPKIYFRKAHGVVAQTTLYEYYVQLINDTLDLIRKGLTAYIFNFEQVAEVFRYEPKARIIYLEKEDCFAVRL